jgi:hypothetical protein
MTRETGERAAIRALEPHHSANDDEGWGDIVIFFRQISSSWMHCLKLSTSAGGKYLPVQKRETAKTAGRITYYQHANRFKNRT